MTNEARTAATGRFRLGPWLVDPASNELVGEQHRARLQPRLMQLLVRLARTPGDVVRREQLLDEVWGRRYVNDEVLSRAIAELRQTLGDDPREPQFIETLPKLGYRLIAAVVPQKPDPRELPTALPIETGAANEPTAPDLPAARPRSWWPAAVFVGVVAAIVAALALWLPPPPGTVLGSDDLRQRIDRARPFATEPGYDQAARFSRDGRLVVWSASDAEQNHAEIWVASPDGMTRRQLTHTTDWDFSPVFLDGDASVAFSRYTAQGCELRRQALLGEHSELIGDCAPVPATSRIDVSPDGRLIAYAQRISDDGRAGIAVRDLASGTQTMLTAPTKEAFNDVNPRFSHDGRHVLFIRGQHSYQRLWVVPIAAPARARAMTDTPGLLYGAAWLPDDSGAVLAGDLFGYRALYRVDASSGAVQFLGGRGTRYPDVSGNGDLVYEIADYQANLWRYDLAVPANKPIPLTQSQRYNNQASWSPDGNQIAFVSNRDGIEAVYVTNIDGTATRRLTLDPKHRWIRPTWSSNGRSILVAALLSRSEGKDCLPYTCTTEHSALYRYDLAANRAELLDALGEDVRMARYSRDGRFIYFLKREDEHMRLWRIGARMDDLARPLLDARVEDFDLDAEVLVVAQQGENGLRVCDLQGMQCRRVLHDASEGLPVVVNDSHWHLHDGAIYFAAPNQVGKLMTQRLKLAPASRVEPVADVVPDTNAPGLAISPDGRYLLFSRNDRITIDLYLGTSSQDNQ